MNQKRHQTILITGATDGIGKLTAEKLSNNGAHVLLHGRNKTKLSKVADEIRSVSGNENIEEFVADFALLEEVEKLSRQVLDKHHRLDVLINNAGIGFSDERQVSEDGYEMCFAVNYLAPFLLTHLLLPALKKASPSRIVNVSSAGQHPIDFNDPMLERHYDSRRAYSQSKLALIMFTKELANQLKSENITVNSLHPGTYLRTKMVVEAGIKPWGEPGTGAEAEVFLATSPDLEGVTGKYFDGKKESQAQAQAYDATARKKLWEMSKEWTGLTK